MRRRFIHTYAHLKGERRGYSGKVLIVSPDNLILEIQSIRRVSEYGWDSAIVKGEKFPSTKLKNVAKRYPFRKDKYLSYSLGVVRKNNSQPLQPYLAQGCKVISNKEAEEIRKREEEKKNTDLVIGTTKSGDKSHGGDNASCEVKDSPNSAEKGEKPLKKRGGKKWNKNSSKNNGISQMPKAVDELVLKSKSAVYLKENYKKDIKPERVKESVNILKNLVGQSNNKIEYGTKVDIDNLLIALEIGDNPIPYFDVPKQKSKAKLLISPDISGSCSGWDYVSRAWAKKLSKNPDLDVLYIENCNGYFHLNGQDVNIINVLKDIDYMIYLGDHDGIILCREYASKGCKVIALSNWRCNNMEAKLDKYEKTKNLFWIDGVSSKSSKDWAKALKLVNF